MFFLLSKIFWMLADPVHLLGFLVSVTALCLIFGRIKTARVLAAAAALLLLLVGFAAVPMARAIEDQYPRPPWPPHVDGILVLSPGFDSVRLRARGVPATNDGIWRLEAGFAAARHYPNAKLVFTGGSGLLEGSPFSEADTARYVFKEMGQDSGQLILESRSRNTYENILFSKALVKPKPGEIWLLTTAAIHMPRAMAIAQKLDWPMLPWPSDYETSPAGGIDLSDVGGNLGLAGYALHEWVGLLAYRLAGKAQ
jgi:uncharacterized SAM-binding protein YcdF (DUF218 family)